MKIVYFSFVLTLFTFIFSGCHKSSSSESEITDADTSSDTLSTVQTYAEISRKTGGTWKDHKYEGGDFQNVDFLRVPDENTDHSFFIRYEGPGWESSKIGYRLYLDWRNATDIFGKLTDEMVLSNVGQDNFDSYHEPADWGMDILKVGSSLGIGSVGRMVDNQVQHFENVDSTTAAVKNTASGSSVTLSYYGWKTGDTKMDLTSVYSIQPGNRYTRHEITPSASVEGLCTGIVKHDSTEVLKNSSMNGEWAYLATYGVQTLVNDKLGMALLYRTAEVKSVDDGEFDHLLVFSPTSGTISFYLLGAWEKEPLGITRQEEFKDYLDGLLEILNNKDSL